MGGAVSDAWACAVATHRDRVALEVDGTTLTYAELDAASARMATALTAASAADANADDAAATPVAIDATTDADTVVRLLGALRAGRVALMLDPRDPPAYRDQLRAIVIG